MPAVTSQSVELSIASTTHEHSNLHDGTLGAYEGDDDPQVLIHDEMDDGHGHGHVIVTNGPSWNQQVLNHAHGPTGLIIAIPPSHTQIDIPNPTDVDMKYPHDPDHSQHKHDKEEEATTNPVKSPHHKRPKKSSIMATGVCGGMHAIKPDEKSRLEEQNRAIAKNRRARRQLLKVAALCCIFMTAEVVGGFIANSLAILTDAAHLLSDLIGFVISIFVLWLSTRPVTSKHSFGYHRAEVLGALVSVLIIWVVTGVLVYEAVMRLTHPEDVDGKLMFIIATCGLGVNIFMGFILYQSEKADAEPGEGEDLNVKAAFIHVLGDGVQSLGVMLGGALIWYNPDWKIADAITTFLFSILVLFTTGRLIKQAVSILMETVPSDIDSTAVLGGLGSLPGVLHVHDLHIWALTLGKPALSVHLLTADDEMGKCVLEEASKFLVTKFGIHHVTIQIEKTTDLIACNGAAPYHDTCQHA